MSILGLADPSKVDVGEEVIGAPAATFGDVFDASIEATARNYMITSKPVFTNLEFAARDKKYKELTGRDIYEDAFMGAPNRAELEQARISRRNKEVVNQAVDSYIERLKATDPEKYGGIMNSMAVEESVKTKAKEALSAQSAAAEGATGFSAVTGQLAGGFTAGFLDPINLATIPLGAGAGMSILRTAIMEAGANVVGEAIAHPVIKKWQDELGQEYGGAEFLQNAGFAALFGGVIGGGGRAIGVGLEKMEISNAAKLAKMREALEKARVESESREALQQTIKTSRPIDEVISALQQEERRIHIDEADPSRTNPDIPPTAHVKALEEVDAAINEGRPIGDVGIPDEQMKKVVPKEFKAKANDPAENRRAAAIKQIEAIPDALPEMPGPEGLKIIGEVDASTEPVLDGGWPTKRVPVTREGVPIKTATIRAVDANGKEIGKLIVSNIETGRAHHLPDMFHATTVEVSPKYRRKGVATALYDYAEKHGMKMTSGRMLTKDSSAFWQNRFKKKGQNQSAFRGKPNEILIEHKVVPKTMEEYQEVMDLYESPEMRKAEKAAFDERFQDPNETVDFGDEKMTVKELKELMAEDDEYFSAISSCGLPKGEG